MAFVDLKNGKIYGCKKKSLTWYHEKGHIEFNKTDKGNSIDFWRGMFFNWTIFSLVINLIINNIYSKTFPIIFYSLFVLLYIYEELWCWFYSFQKYK